MNEPRAYCVNGHDAGPCSCVADPFGGGMCNICLDASRDCDVCYPGRNKPLTELERFGWAAFGAALLGIAGAVFTHEAYDLGRWFYLVLGLYVFLVMPWVMGIPHSHLPVVRLWRWIRYWRSRRVMRRSLERAPIFVYITEFGPVESSTCWCGKTRSPECWKCEGRPDSSRSGDDAR